MAKNTLTGGAFQDAAGNVLANGYLKMKLNMDAVVTGTGPQIAASSELTITLDSSGNIAAAQQVWPTDQLTPTNALYVVSAYTAKGQLVWGPQYVTVTTAPSPFDVKAWVPTR
jgi:hypothetical protein